jgi:hypothetical protein
MKIIIKEIKIKKYTYQLGYNLWWNKIFPKVEIYKGNRQQAWTIRNGRGRDLFSYYVFNGTKSFPSDSNTVKELFERLRLDIDIPETIEKKFEEMILLYKLNDFNEL